MSIVPSNKPWHNTYQTFIEHPLCVLKTFLDATGDPSLKYLDVTLIPVFKKANSSGEIKMWLFFKKSH